MNNSYKKFAYYYDEVMSELDYYSWVEFTLNYLKPQDKILDLACGTGTFLTMLKLKGYDCYGLDLSEEIIEIANEKRKINHLDIDFKVANMIDFKYDMKFDCITCFFDSINFLNNKNDITKMLNNIYDHLNPNGYFIFDIASKTLFDEYDNSNINKDYGNFKIDWITKKTSPKSLKHTISIKEFDEEFKETYFEYFYDLKDLKSNKFKLIKLSGDFNDDLEPEDERILVVYQKQTNI